jgi:tryptophan synthase alpha chain
MYPAQSRHRLCHEWPEHVVSLDHDECRPIIAATSMPSPARRSISETFAELPKQQQIALMPFIPAGYPDLKTTAALLPAMEAGGANLIEVGIPFSDPIADGPVIQAAFTEALAKGLKLEEVFSTIESARATVSIPLMAMVSFSIVYRYGVERFAQRARRAGFDGLIIPDLPPPEAASVCKRIRSAGLDTCLLVAPSTPRARREEIAKLSSGFIYYLSLSGITGERSELPAGLSQGLAEMKSLTDRPICVGFGISRPEHVEQLRGRADGAIVGSGVVRRIQEQRVESPPKIASAIGEYCRQLLSRVR